jgi:hypothetical protein
MPIAPGSPTPPGSPAGPALLAFLDTTSPPCDLAVSVYGELGHRYGDVLPVVAVVDEPHGKVAPWLDEKGFPGPVIDAGSGHRLRGAFEIDEVPTLVLVEGGRVIDVSEGWDEERVNRWDTLLARYTGRRSPGPLSAEPEPDHD